MVNGQVPRAAQEDSEGVSPWRQENSVCPKQRGKDGDWGGWGGLIFFFCMFFLGGGGVTFRASFSGTFSKKERCKPVLGVWKGGGVVLAGGGGGYVCVVCVDLCMC